MVTATSATQARPRPRAGSNSRPDLVEVVLFGGLLLLACLVLLPIALVAAVTAGGCVLLCRRTGWPRWVPLLPLALGAAGVALWTLLWQGDVVAQVAPLVTRYFDAYLTLGVALVDAMRDDTPPQAIGGWTDWLTAVALPAVVVGVPLGYVGAFLSSHRGSPAEQVRQDEHVQVHDAGTLAQQAEVPVPWVLPRVVGQGVLSLVSGPPGIGKSYWTWGLVRAMQDGATFYGLSVRRLTVRRWWDRLARRPVAPARVLWCTEEGTSFAATARAFGIAPGLVCVLRRDQVALTDWPALVALFRREAWRRRCRLVVIDTIRAWCPLAETSNEAAAQVMRVARRELAEPGLGVLFVHHDRKGGGEYGEGVAGAYNLVGSVDVLIELKRVQGNPQARRMLVSRRFGELDVTATLMDGHRYLTDAERTPPASLEEPVQPEHVADPVPAHLRATLAAFAGQEGEPMSTAEVQRATGIARSTVIKHLNTLKARGLLSVVGAGTRRDPSRWMLAGEEPPAPPNPTADPAYVRYLSSAAWKRKRAQVLQRAAGACEVCGVETPESELEIHHLDYANVGHEPLDSLAAMCPADHRRAHAA